MALSLDGNGQLTETGAGSFNIALSTNNPNDVILVAVQGPAVAASGYTITASGLSFLQRGSYLNAGGGLVGIFWAVSTAIFSGNINVSINSWGGFGQFGGSAFAVAGANTLAPFDGNSSLPATTVTTTPPTGSTSNANDFVFAFLAAGSTVTNGAGWIQIGDSSVGITAEYQIASATGSFTGNCSNNTSIVSGQLDALVLAPPVVVIPNPAFPRLVLM